MPDDPTEPAGPDPLPVGPPRYEFLAEIARGGMGAVYRVRDIALNRDVAIKILLRRFSLDSAPARRFMEEAKIAGQLQHPGIPAVHELGTLPDGRPFLAMKLIKGDTLDQLLKASGRRQPAVPEQASGESVGRVESARPDDAGPVVGSSPRDPTYGADAPRSPNLVPVFEQLCQAVAYAHAHQVIHRDLTPANVMVGAFGEVQVMDWGLAKVLASRASDGTGTTAADPELTAALSEIDSDRDEDSATRAGSVLGTPAYMPPEQAIGAIDQIDQQSDVFGLGAILCAIVTGKPPYVGADSESTRQMAARGKLDDAFSRLDGCGAEPELAALCKRCLSVEKSHRPADAGEVAGIVAALRAAADERARQAELDRVKAEESRKRRRVQLTLAGAVVGLAVAVGFGLIVANLWQRAEGERDTAEKARDGERQARGEAETSRDGEEQQRKIAEKERDAANKARNELFLAREALAVSEYGRTLQVAHQAWRQDNLTAAVALLHGTREDLRGWEFGHLHRLCHPELVALKGHTSIVRSASFSPDGSRVVTGSLDKTARIWDAKTGAELLTLKGHTDAVYSASFSPDGSRVVTACFDRTARVWDARTGVEVFVLKGHTDVVYSASFSPDGSRIVTCSAEGTARMWDAKSGAELLILKGHMGNVYSASFSPDGSRVVTGSWDMTARVWDAKTGVEALALKGHTGRVESASFSPEGSRIVTGGWDKTARVWDARTGTELLVLKEYTGVVWSASFSPDGSRIVTGTHDRTAQVWDAKTGAELLTIKRAKPSVSRVSSVSFSHDGSRMVTPSGDQTARVWDARTAVELLILKGHTGLVYSASFSPDGSRIVTGSWDSTARVWDGNRGTELLVLKGHTDAVYSASFSPDGSRVLTCSWDGTALVWDSRPFKDTRRPDPELAPPPRERR